jgi:glutathione reductase (NADPH)
MTYDYDLFVIGGGSSGVRASRLAAQTGARVALAEEYRMGGTCVIRGCIPKKLLVYASHFEEQFRDAASFGWTVGATSFDWPTLIAAKDREITRLESLYEKNVKAAGVAIYADRAEFEDLHTLRLVNSGKKITADKILIATGARPSRDLGGDHLAPGAKLCITSDEAFHLKELPRRILIAGGGYIALEFAHIFQGLGSKVTLVYRGDKVLRGFDEDIRDGICETMKHRGMEVLLGRQFAAIEQHGNCLRATSNLGDVVEADQVMLAIGRVANTESLHAEKAGVELGKRGQVLVDKYSRTSAENIYAIGDVTDRVQLTPVAIHEAMCLVKTLFQDQPTAPGYDVIPTAVFTTPEVGVVGLSEEKALASGASIDVYKSTFRPLAQVLTPRPERMMMKLIVDRANDRLIGCHIFGPNAADMIQLVAVAIKMGATKAQLDATMALHPSAAEELVTMRSKSYSRDPA